MMKKQLFEFQGQLWISDIDVMQQYSPRDSKYGLSNASSQ
jgi:hypothetical protein